MLWIHRKSGNSSTLGVYCTCSEVDAAVDEGSVQGVVDGVSATSDCDNI